MTDRVLTLIVTLDKEFRKDDIQPIVEAIGMIKHVAKVEENVYTCSDQINVSAGISNFKCELLQELIKVLR